MSLFRGVPGTFYGVRAFENAAEFINYLLEIAAEGNLSVMCY
jgi:hypothetical protein